MSQPIQSVLKFEYFAAQRLAAKGDENARHFLATIWDEYGSAVDGLAVDCFICNATIDGPPNTQMLPEQLDQSKLILVPVCGPCWARPAMARINACLDIVKEKFAQQGKQVHINFMAKRTHHR